MLILLILIACLCWGVHIWEKWDDNFAIIIPVFFGWMACLLVFMIGSSFLIETHRTDNKQNIYSLRNSDSISGSFFLGSGAIGGTEYYYTFVENGRGGYYREKYPAYNCHIFQDTDSGAYKFWQTVYYRYPRWLTFWSPTFKKSTMIDLHVPKNTIIERYELK